VALADKQSVKGIKRYEEEKRDRWLQDNELQRLCDILDAHPNQRAASAIRLQLLTGARMGEILGAKKADFDLQRGVWRKPSHQTKQKRTEHLPLSAQAVALVASLMEGSPWDRTPVPRQCCWGSTQGCEEVLGFGHAPGWDHWLPAA
jgi:integrase